VLKATRRATDCRLTDTERRRLARWPTARRTRLQRRSATLVTPDTLTALVWHSSRGICSMGAHAAPSWDGHKWRGDRAARSPDGGGESELGVSSHRQGALANLGHKNR